MEVEKNNVPKRSLGSGFQGSFSNSLSKLLVVFLVAIFLSTLSAVTLASSLGNPSDTGLLVPLYQNLSTNMSEVTGLIKLKAQYPAVPIIVILNNRGGPGTSYSQNYSTATSELEAANITVLGYVATDWAAGALSGIESNIKNWKNLYSVNGIFLDQMSDQLGKQGYYSNLSKYARSLSLNYILGNPGVDTPRLTNYIGAVNSMAIYEGPGVPSLSVLEGANSWHTNYSKSNFALFAYDVNTYNSSFVKQASKYVNFLYVTNEPYNQLPTYISTLMSELNSMDKPPSNGAPILVGSKSSLTITTENQDGDVINGYYAILYQSNSVVATDFSPDNFNLNNGQKYVVQVDNYKSCSFSYWSDNKNTSSNRKVSISADRNLIAIYNCDN